jgi:hypothetical protein
VCTASSFGLLCLQDRAEELATAVSEARAMVADFNRDAKLTEVNVFVICGRIADNDVEAVRAISSELTDLMADMEGGINQVDAEAIRAAANRAKTISAMLVPDMAEKVMEAVTVARKVARDIVKAGEQVAQEVDKQSLGKITRIRTAFLDLESTATVAPQMAAVRAIEAGMMDGMVTDGATGAVLGVIQHGPAPSDDGIDDGIDDDAVVAPIVSTSRRAMEL